MWSPESFFISILWIWRLVVVHFTIHLHMSTGEYHSYLVPLIWWVNAPTRAFASASLKQEMHVYGNYGLAHSQGNPKHKIRPIQCVISHHSSPHASNEILHYHSSPYTCTSCTHMEYLIWRWMWNVLSLISIFIKRQRKNFQGSTLLYRKRWQTKYPKPFELINRI